MITDHPFLDNNGPTYQLGICRECGMGSRFHTHRNIQRSKGSKIYTVSNSGLSDQNPTDEQSAEGAERKAREFSDAIDIKIIKSEGGWRSAPSSSVWNPKSGWRSRG